ncbi:MAG: hypothetical protein ACK5C5_08255 [Bacteroidota bacterium]|jgi:hypothetical protein
MMAAGDHINRNCSQFGENVSHQLLGNENHPCAQNYAMPNMLAEKQTAQEAKQQRYGFSKTSFPQI